MIVVNVSQATKDLTNTFKHLSDSQLNKSIVTGLNKTIRKGRTIARTEVKKIYNIPQRYMNRINHIPATPKRLKASIYASRKPIPMDAFNPRFEFISSAGSSILSISRKGILKARATNRAKNVRGVSIEVQRGKRTVVPYAFMIPTAKPRVFARGQYKSGNGSYGFMQRHSRLENDSGNDSVKPLTSVTIFGAIVNPVVTAPIINQVKKDYVNNLYTALKYQANLGK